MYNNLLQLFPMERRDFWKTTAVEQKRIQEIRIRCGKPVILMMDGKECFLNSEGQLIEKSEMAYRAEIAEIEGMINHICHYSLYAFEDEMRQGFITVAGGHRVGITGQVVLENDSQVRTIKHVSCINIRISHQIKGVADKVLPHLYQSGKLKNVLIISPPGCGKTTLLRDMIRQISDGNSYGEGMCVGVVDERSEIAGSYQGIPQNDVGMRTDVLDACPKALGMMLLLRSMSPRVIAVDELGSEVDIRALHMAASCGSKMIATVHGADMEDVFRRFGSMGTALEHFFDCFLILSKENGIPVVQEIVEREDIHASIHGRNHDSDRVLRTGDVVPRAVCSAPTDFASIPKYLGDADE